MKKLTEDTKQAIQTRFQVLKGSGVPEEAQLQMAAQYAIDILENQTENMFEPHPSQKPMLDACTDAFDKVYMDLIVSARGDEEVMKVIRAGVAEALKMAGIDVTQPRELGICVIPSLDRDQTTVVVHDGTRIVDGQMRVKECDVGFTVHQLTQAHAPKPELSEEDRWKVMRSHIRAINSERNSLLGYLEPEEEG